MRIDVRESEQGSSGNPTSRRHRRIGRIDIDPETRPNLIRFANPERAVAGEDAASSSPSEGGTPPKVEVDAGRDHCFLNWEGALDDSSQLRKCVICGCDRLYRSKVLPQVTPFVVVLAFAGAVIGLLGFATNPLVLPGLVILLAVDIATLALAKERLVCYACGSIYSKIRVARYHRRWNRADAERVRAGLAGSVASSSGS